MSASKISGQVVDTVDGLVVKLPEKIITLLSRCQLYFSELNMANVSHNLIFAEPTIWDDGCF